MSTNPGLRMRVEEIAQKIRELGLSRDTEEDLNFALSFYKKAVNSANVCDVEKLSEGIGGIVKGDEFIGAILLPTTISRPRTWGRTNELIEHLVNLKFQARHEFLERLMATCRCTLEERKS